MAGLRLRTPALELRWPSLGDLNALAGLAVLGVHDPDVQPFMTAWTDVPPDERARTIQVLVRAESRGGLHQACPF
jgi:hypothetical protein